MEKTPIDFVVYVAGPYRAATPFKIAGNVRRAMEHGLEVMDLGFTALIPQANTAGLDGEQSDEYFLQSTMVLMRRCDAVYVLPGSERSAGTQGEIAEARRLGIPVCLTLSGLLAAFEAWKGAPHE